MGQNGSKTLPSKRLNVVRKWNFLKIGQSASNNIHWNEGRLHDQTVRTVENFIIIWLDSNISEWNEDIEHSIRHLQRIVNSVLTFTDRDECINYLSKVVNEKVFVIVSGSLGQDCVPLISQMNQLAWIYVFCGDEQKHQQWASNYKKIKGVYTKIGDVCKALKLDVRQSEHDLTPISIIASSSTTDLNELDPSFMYTQLLKEILLEDESTLEERKQLVDFCRLHYANNDKELAVIAEFEKEYPSPSVIYWYTRECFLYPMLNKALRAQDIEMIMKMGFILRDLHRHIEKLHAEQNLRESLILYRGQGMTSTEFDKIKRNVGGLLAFNNFLSTSIDRQVSLGFARRARNNLDLTAVLFQINIDPKLSTTAFASLDKISYYKEQEKEILFSMHIVFRIIGTIQIEDRLFQVNLTLTDDSDQQLTRLTQYMRQAIRGSKGLYRMAQLMIEMGEFNKSEEIYTALIETRADDDREELAHIYHQLGRINKEQSNLSDALSYYQRSLEIYLTYLSSDDPRLSATYTGIGTILQQQGNLDSALQHFELALDIEFHAPQPDQQTIATRYNNIGSVLESQGKYDEALMCYEQTLEIELVYLPPRHPSVATTYNNIGGVHQKMGDNSSALSFLQKALEIRQRSLPPHHPSLASTHYNMAFVLNALHRTVEAIEHAQQAVEIGRRSLGSNHPSVQEDQQYLDKLRQNLIE